MRGLDRTRGIITHSLIRNVGITRTTREGGDVRIQDDLRWTMYAAPSFTGSEDVTLKLEVGTHYGSEQPEYRFIVLHSDGDRTRLERREDYDAHAANGAEIPDGVVLYDTHTYKACFDEMVRLWESYMAIVPFALA